MLYVYITCIEMLLYTGGVTVDIRPCLRHGSWLYWNLSLRS